MELSFVHWEDLQLLFISSDEEDLVLANEILTEKKFDTDKLEELMEKLNLTYRGWHFFMENCRIKRVRAQKYAQCSFK
jgi:hypothetical protein